MAGPDLEIHGKGFYSITGRTHSGRNWMIAHVEGTDCTGFVYSDDTRMTQDIADGAVATGLAVQVNGQIYRGEEN